MPSDKWERVICVSSDKMPIAVTDPNRRHFNEDLTDLWFPEIDFLDTKKLTRGKENGGSNFHSATLP